MQAVPAIYGPAARIGIVGLGAGTLSCYAQPGQDWRIFEIDPTVVRLSKDDGRFTFLSRCAPQAKIVIGDARLSLATEPPSRLHLLAIDAFSSDSVPIHLLTREALRVYGRALRPDGLLLIHVSNRYIDLEPVLSSGANMEGWHAALRDDYINPKLNHPTLIASVWVALSRDKRVLDRLRGFHPPKEELWYDLYQPDFPGWTDDYATILPLLKAFKVD
jgi:spermidine synthase